MKTYILYYITQTRFIIAVSVIFAAVVSASVYAKRIQTDIADEVIRFHILANSDSEEDQKLKLKVKNEIINMLEPGLRASSSKAETKAYIIENLDKIEEKAAEVIKTEGYTYDVKAELAYSDFPTKAYGDIKLPCGEYEALRILIGNAQGQNWWCVMFPPLCFVDAAAKEVPDENKKQLKSILTDDEYSLISSADKGSVKVKFKIVELFD